VEVKCGSGSPPADSQLSLPSRAGKGSYPTRQGTSGFDVVHDTQPLAEQQRASAINRAAEALHRDGLPSLFFE